MHYYVPYGQEREMGGTKLLVRPSGKLMAMAPILERIAQELDPAITLVSSESLQSHIDPQLRPWRLGASILTMMGLLALVVATIGLYSVMSYLVAQRQHELGVRVALGASGISIVALVMRGGIGMALMGVAIGLAAAIALGQWAAPLLFQTSPRDATVFVSVGLAMLLVASLATLVPAMRARRANPLSALRAE
jgi:ABC-type antimicrobial peptide transport system permease subunit